MLKRLSLACLGALIVGSSPVAAAETSLSESVPHITLSGTAHVEVVPNLAVISLGIETERPSASDAAQDNAKTAQTVVAEIKAQGVEARDILTTSVTLSPVYDETRDQNGRVTKQTLRGYKARNELDIRVRDVAKAGVLARQLIDKGANRVEGIDFQYEHPEDKYDALRREAILDALRKAKSYIEPIGGLKLGRVLEIQSGAGGSRTMGVGFAPAPMAKRASAVAVPVEPGLMTLSTEVTVTWELAQ